jgi:chromosomal replication initiation ATPase DnaA
MKKEVKYSGKSRNLPPKIMSYDERRVVNSHLEEKVIEVANIVAIENGTTLSRICEKNRRGDTVLIRQIAHKIARETTNAPLYLIGEIIGKKDHATCLHSIKVINEYFDTKSSIVIEMYNRSKAAVESGINNLGIEFNLLKNILSMAQL